MSTSFRNPVFWLAPKQDVTFLAEAFGEMMKKLWFGHEQRIMPRDFRRSISQFQPDFANMMQHDAQELLNFLLDTLHGIYFEIYLQSSLLERVCVLKLIVSTVCNLKSIYHFEIYLFLCSEDLNRITDKPYIELPDSDGRPSHEGIVFHDRALQSLCSKVIVFSCSRAVGYSLKTQSLTHTRPFPGIPHISNPTMYYMFMIIYKYLVKILFYTWRAYKLYLMCRDNLNRLFAVRTVIENQLNSSSTCSSL